MKPLTELGRRVVHIDEINKVAEFMRLAIAIGGSRRMSDPIRTQARKMSPRLDAILGDFHDVYQMTPQQIVDFERAAVGAGTTVDSTFAEPLAAYQVIAGAFAESLKNFGCFDAMLPFMRRQPLHSRAMMLTGGFTASTVGQMHPKPITQGSVTGTTLDEKKAVAIAVLTEEQLRFSMAAITDFQTELQNAVATKTDETFLATLQSGATSFGSSGVTAEHIRNDLRAALGNISRGTRSRIFLIMPPAIHNVLAVLYTETGAGAFPEVRLNGGVDGGNISGMQILVSDGVASGTVLVADASQIAAGADTITLSSSNQTTLEMDTVPTSPPSASTAYVSLWQMNWRALRAERYFGAVKLSTTGCVAITSVNWIGGSPG